MAQATAVKKQNDEPQYAPIGTVVVARVAILKRPVENTAKDDSKYWHIGKLLSPKNYANFHFKENPNSFVWDRPFVLAEVHVIEKTMPDGTVYTHYDLWPTKREVTHRQETFLSSASIVKKMQHDDKAQVFLHKTHAIVLSPIK